MSTLKKTIWFCEHCQKVGSVAVDEHEGVSRGAHKVLDGHREKSPRCKADNPKVLNLRLIVEPHVPDWAAEEIFDLLAV